MHAQSRHLNAAQWLCSLLVACGPAQPEASVSALPAETQTAATLQPAMTPPSAAGGRGASMQGARQGPAGSVAPMAAAAAGQGGRGAAPVSAAGAGGSAVNAPRAQAGAGSAAPATHDHCLDGEPPDPRDAQLTGQPDTWVSPSTAEVDLVLPKLVLSWMAERVWEPSHDAWHNVRRCRAGLGLGPGSGGGMNICEQKQLIPEHQECADAEDGYQFLVMHRHMLRALAQAFPANKSLFEGFAHFPFEASAVPTEWRGRWGNGWSDAMRQTATTLEDIENQLSMFPSEGDLGRFIQCGGMGNGASSIHGALHFKWVVNDSPYSLGKQTVNIDNFMFWKLHGWIDSIWERYRVAKGLASDEPKLQQAIRDQCSEMHMLGHVIKPDTGTTTSRTLPDESGEFHEQVRPILERSCSSCHSESSPEAMLSLGGALSSADVVKGLVDVQAVHGGQFKRVVPGNSEQSWLYLKAAGLAQTVGCSGAMCNAQVMPPTGQVTLSQAELSTIQRWIDNGAPAP